MSATVLLVEDSPTQALHVQNLLEPEGIHVVLAADGPEGVRLAQMGLIEPCVVEA